MNGSHQTFFYYYLMCSLLLIKQKHKHVVYWIIQNSNKTKHKNINIVMFITEQNDSRKVWGNYLETSFHRTLNLDTQWNRVWTTVYFWNRLFLCIFKRTVILPQLPAAAGQVIKVHATSSPFWWGATCYCGIYIHYKVLDALCSQPFTGYHSHNM